jgi:hypothetical protein
MRIGILGIGILEVGILEMDILVGNGHTSKK